MVCGSFLRFCRYVLCLQNFSLLVSLFSTINNYCFFSFQSCFFVCFKNVIVLQVCSAWLVYCCIQSAGLLIKWKITVGKHPQRFTWTNAALVCAAVYFFLLHFWNKNKTTKNSTNIILIYDLEALRELASLCLRQQASGVKSETMNFISLNNIWIFFLSDMPYISFVKWNVLRLTSVTVPHYLCRIILRFANGRKRGNFNKGYVTICFAVLSPVEMFFTFLLWNRAVAFQLNISSLILTSSCS